MTMTTKKMTDDELATHFEDFDFDNAIQTDRDPLHALHWAAQFREYMERELSEVVAEARESGTTWTQIGAALGVSHQAAMKRYKQPA